MISLPENECETIRYFTSEKREINKLLNRDKNNNSLMNYLKTTCKKDINKDHLKELIKDYNDKFIIRKINNDEICVYTILSYYISCDEPSYDIIKFLIENNSSIKNNINAINITNKCKDDYQGYKYNYEEFTFLSKIIKYEINCDIINFLIKHGADITLLNNQSLKNFCESYFDNDDENIYEIIKLLIENGADVNYNNIRASNKNISLLEYICITPKLKNVHIREKLAKFLIEKGATIPSNFFNLLNPYNMNLNLIHLDKNFDFYRYIQKSLFTNYSINEIKDFFQKIQKL